MLKSTKDFTPNFLLMLPQVPNILTTNKCPNYAYEANTTNTKTPIQYMETNEGLTRAQPIKLPLTKVH